MGKFVVHDAVSTTKKQAGKSRELNIYDCEKQAPPVRVGARTFLFP